MEKLPEKWQNLPQEQILIPTDEGLTNRHQAEHSLGGLTDKYFTDGDNYPREEMRFIKIDDGQTNPETGEFTPKFQGLREDLISRALKFTNLRDMIQYRSKVILTPTGWQACTESNSYQEDDYQERTFFDITNDYRHRNETIDSDYDTEDADYGIMDKQIQWYQLDSGVDFSEDLFKLWSFDSIINNVDRLNNSGNMGLMSPEFESWDDYKLVPPFDWGDSFQRDLMEDMNWQAAKKEAKAFRRFIAQYTGKDNILLEIDSDGIFDLLRNYTNPIYSSSEVDDVKNWFETSLNTTRDILWTEKQ
ncbi:hypothetical protein ACQW5G_04010 [Fructilactobacillus sp. Tb1]|uniref:hypothetical protein n=1 Tax=Fructilactobacillus sp. Tb1 TaxID=3422304 RepID=UPI003D2BE8B6